MQTAQDPTDNVIELPRPAALGSALAWLIWSVSAIFVLFQFFLQLSSGVIVEGLMKSFSLSAFGGGLLASAYYYIYVSLQAPAGFLVDHYGTRRVLSIGALVCSLGCVLFATANQVSVAVMGRLLMGMGAAFAFVGSMNLASRWFPLHRFGLMAAMAETSGMIGSLFGGYWLAHLVQNYGWRHSIEIASMIALLIGLLLMTIVRNAPRHMTPIIPRTKKVLWQEVKLLMNKPAVWLNGVYSAAVFSVITVFVALWAVPFMQKMHHLSLSRATLLCNLVFVGVAFGAPLFGWMDGRLRSRKILLVGAAFINMLLLLVVIFGQDLSITIVSCLMVLVGIFSSSYVLNFVIANEVSTAYTRSTSIGITNMASVGSAPVLQPLIGLTLYLLSDHSHQTSFDTYTIAHFQMALLIIPFFILVAAIIGFWLPDRQIGS